MRRRGDDANAHAAVLSEHTTPMSLAHVLYLRPCCSFYRSSSYNASKALSFSGRALPSRHGALAPQIRSFAGKKSTQQTLSRQEKRRQARDLKRRQKKGNEMPKQAKAPTSSPWRERLDSLKPHPRMPGGSSNFGKEQMVAVAKRLPFFILLAGLTTYEDTTPLKLDRAFGPSMLPTIHPLGDLYLRATGAWQRALGIQYNYKVGDVVAIANSNGRGHSCKRIIGVEGDKVLRYGQLVGMYRDRPDLGIVPPRQPEAYNLSWENDSASDDKEKDFTRTVTVPPSFVWVEGDNPLFSVDSRHYGPVPVASIRGRLLMRVWPLWRNEVVKPSPVIMSRERPAPLTLEEALAVRRYNLYKKSVPGREEKPEWS